MPSLYRESDGSGDQGGMQLLLRVNPDTQEIETKTAPEPEVGWAIRVGSLIARSYSGQDYWQTSIITEILERKQTADGVFVRFKTGNSIYVWTE